MVSSIGTKAEKSPYSQTYLWKSNVAFMTFFLGEARRSAKLWDNFRKAENPKMRLAAAERLAKWAGGKTVSGAIASYIVALTYSDLGDDEWWEDAKRDPAMFLFNSWYMSVVGGIFATAGLTLGTILKTGETDKAVVDGIRAMSFPISIALESVQLLINAGQYRKKTIGDFVLNRVPVSKRGVALDVIIGLGTLFEQDGKFKGPKLRTAERSYWKWKDKHDPFTGGSRGSLDKEKKDFYMALNRASILYLDGKTEEADKIVAGVIYAGDPTREDSRKRIQDVRAYLSRQQRIRPLENKVVMIGDKEVNLKESLKDFMSPGAYALLEAWDEAIEGLKPSKPKPKKKPAKKKKKRITF